MSGLVNTIRSRLERVLRPDVDVEGLHIVDPETDQRIAEWQAIEKKALADMKCDRITGTICQMVEDITAPYRRNGEG